MLFLLSKYSNPFESKVQIFSQKVANFFKFDSKVLGYEKLKYAPRYTIRYLAVQITKLFTQKGYCNDKRE